MPQFSIDHDSSLLWSFNFAELELSGSLNYIYHILGPQIEAWLWKILINNWHTTSFNRNGGGIVGDQEVIDLRWTLSWCASPTLQSADPMVTARPNSMPDINCIVIQLEHKTGSILCTHTSCSVEILARRRSSKSRILPMTDRSPNRVPSWPEKKIQMNFTRFTITFEPKVQITQNKNLVKDIVSIYHIIVILTKLLCQFLRKKS